MATRSWSGSVHERIAAAIKAARRERGRLTADELADETARLGYPISRSQIANYESGRRHSLDVVELLVIAAALQIPPLALLFPEKPSARVQVLPGQEVSALHAIHQFVGDRAPLWPHGEVAALIKQLDRIGEAVGAAGGSGSLSAGVREKT